MRPYTKEQSIGPVKEKGQKKCPHCGNLFFPKTSLQKYCMERKGCISVFLDKAKIKPKSKVPKNARPDLYVSENKKDLQNLINRIARLIDKGVRCIDCEVAETKQWDAGHYHSVGSHPALRYNLFNIHAQTSYCNKYKNQKHDYREGVKAMYGHDYLVNIIDDLPNVYPRLNLLHDELPDLKREANAIIRELKKADRVYSVQERIDLRQEINVRLGIYL